MLSKLPDLAGSIADVFGLRETPQAILVVLSLLRFMSYIYKRSPGETQPGPVPTPSPVCPTCGGSLSAVWPYLDREPYMSGEHHIDDWISGRAAGCALCEVVCMAVEEMSKDYAIGTDFKYSIMEPSEYAAHGNQMLEVRLVRKHNRLVLVLGLFDRLAFSTMNPFSLTVYPEEQDSPLEPYQPILWDRFSLQGVSRARQWLTQCQEHHPKCRSPVNEVYPERLLELTDDGVRLQSYIHGNPLYVALSHCWGSTQPIRLLRHNVSDRQRGIHLRELPQTFQEAIRTTRALGLQYLWIDTLCIIQDSNEDWEKQSAMMASIYGNAELVLAASAAASTETGFRYTVKPMQEAVRRVQLDPGDSQSRHVYLRFVAPPAINGPLDERAWAYQEQVVAKRCLSYGSNELLWNCRETEVTESDWNLSIQEQARKKSMPICLDRLFDTSSCGDNILGLWRDEILVRYATRKLSKQSDVLVALSAVAAAFQAKTKWTYLAGLWKEDLVRSLNWYCDMPYYTRDAGYCPSWSWASIDNIGGTTCGHVVKELAVILQARASLASINAFGPVTEGVLRLGGPSIQATLLKFSGGWPVAYESELHVPEFFHASISSLVEIDFKPDTQLEAVNITMLDGSKLKSARRMTYSQIDDGAESDDEALPIWIVLLVTTRNDSRQKKYHTYPWSVQGLMLGHSGLLPNLYQRLGTCYFRTFYDNDSGLKAVEKLMKYREFSLV